MDGITLGTLEMTAIHPVVLFEVADDRFDGLSASELFVFVRGDPLLLASVDDSDTRVLMVDTAIAEIDESMRWLDGAIL